MRLLLLLGSPWGSAYSSLKHQGNHQQGRSGSSNCPDDNTHVDRSQWAFISRSTCSSYFTDQLASAVAAPPAFPPSFLQVVSASETIKAPLLDDPRRSNSQPPLHHKHGLGLIEQVRKDDAFGVLSTAAGHIVTALVRGSRSFRGAATTALGYIRQQRQLFVGYLTQ
jgi:hypothetical protein